MDLETKLTSHRAGKKSILVNNFTTAANVVCNLVTVVPGSGSVFTAGHADSYGADPVEGESSGRVERILPPVATGVYSSDCAAHTFIVSSLLLV